VKRALLVALALLVVAALGAGVAYYLHVKHASRDVHGSSTVEFVPTATPPVPKEPGVAWGMYGRDPARERVLESPAPAAPFRHAWTFHAQSLVEFPPAVAYGRIFFANNAGVLFAVGAENGRKAWSYRSHRCQAASPAVDRRLVIQVFLNAPPCNRPNNSALTGEVIAFHAGSGEIAWRHVIGPSETSPLINRGVAYVGDWRGRVYAYSVLTGHVWWTAQLGGEIKGGVALSGGRIYVADYSSHVYALDAGTGKIIWRSSAQERFGATGRFYATPTVAYGRVYVGATDGKVYSFGAATGKLRWSTSTGGYVYSSTAVDDDRVYAGSYSHGFYCFDAATGRVLWRFQANGPISGSPSIVGDRVYFATLSRTTYALERRTGKQLWTFPDGKYSPVVADKSRLYLVGYARIYGLVPRHPVPSTR
jgi:outer membrane protein assembly factor BamB